MAIRKLNGIPVSEIRKKAETWHPSKKRYKVNKRRRVLINLALRDGMTCKYCQRPVEFDWMSNLKKDAENLATFEHKKLKSEGGKLTVANGDIACFPCNQNRNNQPLKQFLAKMEQGYYAKDEVEYRRKVRKAQLKAKCVAEYKVRRNFRRKKACKKVITVVWNILTLKTLDRSFVSM